jgi:hypothetical protein
VAAIAHAYGLHTEAERDAIARAYRVFHTHHAQFVTAVSAEMLRDLHRDVDERGARIVFLGRDGHPYATAVRGLDPDFAETHTVEIVLSRAVVDAALTDLEDRTGARFHAVEAFRVRDRIDPATTVGAFQALSDYLDDAGVPTAGGVLTFVDNSFKGTIQELYTAAYPDVEVHGRYAIHGTHPDDPHPGNKTGYALHLPADTRWRGYPLAELPAEPELTLGAAEAVAAIEHTLHGPDTSPAAIDTTGPVQGPQRRQPAPLRGYNPALITPPYRDARVREAVKVAALLAVHDAAVQARPRWTGAPAQQTQPERTHAIAAFADDIRAWITKAPQRDPGLSEVLDAFVRRRDRALLSQVYDQLVVAGLDPAEPAQHWIALLPTTPDHSLPDHVDAGSAHHDGPAPHEPPSFQTAMQHLRSAVDAARRGVAADTQEQTRTPAAPATRPPRRDTGTQVDPLQNRPDQDRPSGYDSGY